MFRAAACVFKDGELVVRDGEVDALLAAAARSQVRPDARHRDASGGMEDYYDARYGLPSDFMRVPDGALAARTRSRRSPCRG